MALFQQCSGLGQEAQTPAKVALGSHALGSPRKVALPGEPMLPREAMLGGDVAKGGGLPMKVPFAPEEERLPPATTMLDGSVVCISSWAPTAVPSPNDSWTNCQTPRQRCRRSCQQNSLPHETALHGSGEQERDVPPGLPPPPGLPSHGSVLHAAGRCAPCGFFYKAGGCTNGSECRHCHLCPPGAAKRRQKQRKDADHQQRRCQQSCAIGARFFDTPSTSASSDASSEGSGSAWHRKNYDVDSQARQAAAMLYQIGRESWRQGWESRW